jgi:uncharacterized protein Yka (UPF0111/DUF47 family)
MTEKHSIIKELGEEGLLLPTLVNTALLANDRIKYFFTLLQTATDHAAHPERDYPALRTERETAGIEIQELDTVVSDSELTSEGVFFVPMLSDIISAIIQCTEEMSAPLMTGNNELAQSFTERKNSLITMLPSGQDGTIGKESIRLITSGDRADGDSIHLLVMDLHRALNQIQATLSKETINGAMAYMLMPGDDVLVRAFMAGIKKTSPLKFDHPGLGTTATRAGSKVIIQNDIGITDAHVLVVNIEELKVSIIYTDIHMQRVQFFQSLFFEKGVHWQDTLSRQGSEQFEKKVYHLSVGVFTAQDSGDLTAFLTFLASRIVFLIDWNRARKQLRNFLLNKDCIVVLKWAADNEVGHMGFLKLGGEKIIFSALELAAKVPLRYGEPLHQLLGQEKTVEYLKWVLKTASNGLLQNQSVLLLQDEIKTELLRNFRFAHEGMMDICVEHASLLIEVGTAVRDSLFQSQRSGDGDFIERSARRAKEWESKADQLVMQVRLLSRRFENAEFFFTLIHAADDVLDFLEEASFVTSMLPLITRSKTLNDQLAGMADLAVKGSQEYLKMLISAQAIHREYNQEDMQEFLTSVNRVLSLEHECDEALRQIQKKLFFESRNYKELQLYSELARLIEESTNSLMTTVYIMHDHILEDMSR